MSYTHYGALNSAGEDGQDYSMFGRNNGESPELIIPNPFIEGKLIVPGEMMNTPEILLHPNPGGWLMHMAKVPIGSLGGQLVSIDWHILVVGAKLREQTGGIRLPIVLWQTRYENQYTLIEWQQGEIGLNCDTGLGIKDTLPRLLGDPGTTPAPVLKSDSGFTVIDIPKRERASSF